MKYKIIAYATSVVAAIALCITALLGFKLINYKSVLENSGEDSVVVVKAVQEVKDEEIVIFERSYFDVLGKSLFSVIKDDDAFDISAIGFVEGINGIKPNPKENFWSLTSPTHDECKSNDSQQCGVGSSDLYLSTVNEVIFKYTPVGFGTYA